LTDIYGTRDNIPKDRSAYIVFRTDPQVSNTHNEWDKKKHAFKRRILRQAFTDSALKSVEDKILKSIRQFCLAMGTAPALRPREAELLSALGWSAPRNMANWFTYLTFDVLGHLSFSSDFGMLSSDMDRDIPELLMDRLRRNAIVRYLIARVNPPNFRY
jgi:hypothetical protein